MLSFGALLEKVLKRRQEISMEQTLNMRVAYHADAKDWKKWLRATEKAVGVKKAGPQAFRAAVSAGALNMKRKR